jgi:hypothetical protein
MIQIPHDDHCSDNASASFTDYDQMPKRTLAKLSLNKSPRTLEDLTGRPSWSGSPSLAGHGFHFGQGGREDLLEKRSEGEPLLVHYLFDKLTKLCTDAHRPSPPSCQVWARFVKSQARYAIRTLDHQPLSAGALTHMKQSQRLRMIARRLSTSRIDARRTGQPVMSSTAKQTRQGLLALFHTQSTNNQAQLSSFTLRRPSCQI